MEVVVEDGGRGFWTTRRQERSITSLDLSAERAVRMAVRLDWEKIEEGKRKDVIMTWVCGAC